MRSKEKSASGNCGKTRRHIRKEMVLGIPLLLLYLCSFLMSSNTHPVSVSHYVQSGDSWWSICSKYAAQYGDSRDMREIVYSNRTDRILYPGQVVLIRLEASK